MNGMAVSWRHQFIGGSEGRNAARTLVAKVAETFVPVHCVENPRKTRNTETLCEFRYVDDNWALTTR